MRLSAQHSYHRPRLINVLRAVPLIIAANLGYSQQYGEQDMQQLMQQAQQAQACFAKIDRNEMEQVRQRGLAMEAEVKAMCAKGQRDAAMQQATAFAKELQHNKALEQARKCGEHFQAMMPDMGFYEDLVEKQSSHVCDSYQ